MSFKASVEFILHLHSFQNQKLPHRGKYALQACIYEQSHQKNFATPYHIIEASTKQKKLINSKPNIDDIVFRSKSMDIVYIEELYILQDICQFKIILDAFPEEKRNDWNVFLEIRLLENAETYGKRQSQIQIGEIPFREADCIKFKISRIKQGIFSYVNSEFSNDYIATFDFTILGYVTDYRLCSYKRNLLPKNKQPQSSVKSEISRQRINELKELMFWCQTNLENCQNAAAYFYRNYVGDLRYNSTMLRSKINEMLKEANLDSRLLIPLRYSDEKVQKQAGKYKTVNQGEFSEYVLKYLPQFLDDDAIRSSIFELNLQSFQALEKIKENYSLMRINLPKIKAASVEQIRQIYSSRLVKVLTFGSNLKRQSETKNIMSKARKQLKMHPRIAQQKLYFLDSNLYHAVLEVNLPQFSYSKQYEQNPINAVLNQLTTLKRLQDSQSVFHDQRNMLIIFCHGLQGSSNDMQIIKLQIKKCLPVANYLVSKQNQFETEGDIARMGQRLSIQIKKYVHMHNLDPNNVILNFVGHSMGGIIARASLKLLQLEYKSNQFGFYFTLSTPHLGYLNDVNALIGVGMWFMRKQMKMVSLDQLAMEQSKSTRQSFLYKLSKEGNLTNFKKVILISNSDDSYVPWHSARIASHRSSNSESKIQNQMINNILGEKVVHRLELQSRIEGGDINSFIGRTAHIDLIVKDCIFKFILSAVPDLLDIWAI